MNLPNKLTLFRILLVPMLCLVWLFPYDQFDLNIGYLTFDHVSLSYLNIIENQIKKCLSDNYFIHL